MTTAQARVVRINQLTIALALVLVGCRPSQTIYQIEGASTLFCVPSSIDITPSRPGQSNPIKGGFSLNGCWKSGNTQCVGSNAVISLFVSDSKSIIGRRFRNFPDDAHIKVVATKERGRAGEIANGLISIPDNVNAGKSYIWNVKDGQVDAMAPDDEFMATCVSNSQGNGYFCDRHVAGRDFLLGYSIFSLDKPESFETLDSDLIETIEGMRCKK